MSPALAVLLAAALGANVRIETGIRTEARVRRLEPAPTPAEKDAVDLSAYPHLNLGVTGGLGEFAASYSPRVTAADVGPDLRWEHLHEGDVRLKLAPGPIWSLEGFGSGGIGRTDLVTENRNAGAVTGTGVGTGTGTGTGIGTGTGTGAPGTTGPGSGTSTIPTVGTVDLQRWRAGLQFHLQSSRRTEFTLSGAVSEDGGNNRVSQIVLPVARGADASADWRWSATRLDQLGLRLTAAQSRIAALSTDSGWASALGTWRHRLAPDLEFWWGAGAVGLQSRIRKVPSLPERETKRQVKPAGELGVLKTPPAPEQPAEQGAAGAQPGRGRLALTGGLIATLGATVDRLTGVATPQLEVRSDGRLPVTTSVAIVGSGLAALTWPDTGRTRRGQLQLGASFQVASRTLVDLGGYGSWQNSDDPAVPDISEYGGFLRLSLDAPPLTY